MCNLPSDDQAGDWAAVYLQDVYNGLAPEVEPGEVKKIAVVQEVHRALINSPGILRPARATYTSHPMRFQAEIIPLSCLLQSLRFPLPLLLL